MSTPGSEGAAAPDTAALMADLEREVRARRRSGDLPEGFEAELDAAFAAVAPPGATGSGFEAVLERAERQATQSLFAPIPPSRYPGLRFVKRVLRRVFLFVLVPFAHQIEAFAAMTLRAVRLLGKRVDALEAMSPARDPRLAALAASVDDDLDTGPWATLVLEQLAGATGRVLHADCGRGDLVVALAGAGLDAYGADGREEAAAEADAKGVEVRSQPALEHLRAVGTGALGGLVLSSAVDRLALGDLVELARRAHDALVPGAPLVVLGTHPAAWARGRSAVAVDLAPGRPLHGETWVRLLREHGFDGVHLRAGDTPALAPTGDGPADGNFRLLAAAVLVPETYAVTATRAR